MMIHPVHLILILVLMRKYPNHRGKNKNDQFKEKSQQQKLIKQQVEVVVVVYKERNKMIAEMNTIVVMNSKKHKMIETLLI